MISAREDRLIGAAEMARRIGYQPGSLQRLRVRQRLERDGCPAPRRLRPLQWSERAVTSWIATGAPPPALAEMTSEEAERAAWRQKLDASYGGQNAG